MSKRLSKISRELKIGITAIADFLNKNGYQCEEDPDETINDEIVEFVYSNIKSYISGDNIEGGVVKSEQIKSDKTDKVPIPLELKIVDAASKQKKLIERIIGFSDFDWHYTITKFNGVCSQPVNFNLFDEAICAILLKGETSAKSIGKILGFDIETDPAEREILLSAIRDLIKDEMIDGDESVYWLTDTGREYANNGVKFSTFERDFELYIDATGNLRESAKEVFSKLKSEKQNTFQRENLPQNIEDVKPLAEVQAPEIHFPAKKFILQSCQPIGAEGYIAKVWVVLLENFRDNTIRSLVYDEKQDAIIESLSESFDSLEEERNKLFDKLLSESEEDDFTVESTIEQKKESQILSEKELIEKQKEIDTAIANNDVDKIASIHKGIVEVKRHFNSLEFEVELKRLFDETSDELWIISPWIKKYATFRRIPFFENYLRKGGRIFIAYSLPENNTDTMADPEALEKLYELEQKYHNFYIHQLPAFHYKRVWLRSKEGKDLYYTGSYNILSFFVKQGLQNYRQEEMSRLDWNSENDEEYEKIFLKFGEKYLNDTVDSLNELCQSKAPIDKDFLQKIKGANYGKIKVFLNKGYGVFDDKFAEIEQTKENNLNHFKKIYYTEQLEKIKADLTDVKDKTIPFERRKSFQSRLNILTNEYPVISQTEEYSSVEEMLKNIKVFEASNYKQKKGQFKKKKRK
ncbi:MAG: hypothetical protein MJZ45_04270 [Bacteroidales bacterium]|nr:hypothetical protein [Bacteroidales bacterium]